MIFLEVFIPMFVVMDPFGVIPFFIMLTKGLPNNEVRKCVNNAIFVAGFLLLLFLFFGLEIFRIFGIGLTSFQIAGGLLLLIMGILYVLGINPRFEKNHIADVSVPIGIPLLTGPGVITTTIILSNQYGTFMTFLAACLTLFLSWVVLVNSSKIHKVLGHQWINVISKVMGIILAAIAVGYIKDGIVAIVRSL